MGSLKNKVILLGNLTADPENKKTEAGVSVTQFGIATNDRWKDKDGNKKEKATFHNVVAWRGLADVCAKYLKKGDKILIEGKVDNVSWEDENGNKKYRTDILLLDMEMLGSPSSKSEQIAEEIEKVDPETAHF